MIKTRNKQKLSMKHFIVKYTESNCNDAAETVENITASKTSRIISELKF